MHEFGIRPNACMKPPPFVNLFLSKSGAKYVKPNSYQLMTKNCSANWNLPKDGDKLSTPLRS